MPGLSSTPLSVTPGGCRWGGLPDLRWFCRPCHPAVPVRSLTGGPPAPLLRGPFPRRCFSRPKTGHTRPAHVPRGGTENDSNLFPKRGGEKLREPPRLDRGREGQEHLAFAIARLDLADFRGRDQPCVLDHALAREHAAASVHERATERSFLAPDRDLIGKTSEHAARDCAGRRGALRHVETFRAGDPEELFPELRRFPGRARVHA